MSTQLFTNAHIATGMPGSTAAQTTPLQDILIEDGKFVEIGEGLAAKLAAQGKDRAHVETVDLGGKLVCPPFCDTHLHLDYVFTARKPGAVNESGPLFEGIQRWSETKSDLTVDEIKERAKIGIAKEMRHGVQFIRSHADVTDPNLTSLKALLELKEELKDILAFELKLPAVDLIRCGGGDLIERGDREARLTVFQCVGHKRLVAADKTADACAACREALGDGVDENEVLMTVAELQE